MNQYESTKAAIQEFVHNTCVNMRCHKAESPKNSYEKVWSIESSRHNRRKFRLIKKSIGKLEILANKFDQSKSNWRATENYRNDATEVQNPLSDLDATNYNMINIYSCN